MGIESRIVLAEVVENKERRFGAALEYYPAYIEYRDGEMTPALFTADELNVARRRAKRNMEDIPREKGFFEKLLFG